MGNVLIAMDKSNSFRIYLTDTTSLVEKAKSVHETTPLSAAVLGRVLTATGLMGIMLKNEKDKVTVQFKGDGPAKEVLATANGEGHVKGYVSNSKLDLPLKSNGKLDVGASLGIGELTVIKDIGLKEPYLGRIALVSGEIAEDLTAYFYISEQQNSSVNLGVMVGKDYSVTAAGGMIIQMLPDFKEEAVTTLENMLDEIEPITKIIAEEHLKSDDGNCLKAVLERIFNDVSDEFKPRILEEKSIKWKCDCSKDRYYSGLMALNESDLTEMIEEDEYAEVVCQFCRKKYYFSKKELEEIRKEVKHDN
ncbi:MAG TPA: Hsp33 family molecular chaperone HslO [Anaerovoracaceae bacterium]|nr:Hsp33 family molecular chaperone HslO [Anaerovoracaceae bacterium]